LNAFVGQFVAYLDLHGSPLTKTWRKKAPRKVGCPAADSIEPDAGS
jgi:hypothetical protein